ncbi:hypothetical protein D3C76_817520 [compost metagenome]
MQSAAQFHRQVDDEAAGVGLAQARAAASGQCLQRLGRAHAALYPGRRASVELIGVVDHLQPALGAELVQGIGQGLRRDVEILRLGLGLGRLGGLYR